jgi:hypothetical protein
MMSWWYVHELRESITPLRKPISAYTNAKELRNFMANAKRLGRDDLWREAFKRLCGLEGLNYDDQLDRDFYEMLAAYEELLAAKHGKRIGANRTRRKLKNKGVVQCLEDWATSTQFTQGFDMLVENGLPELTGEALVLKHSSRFSEKAVAAARKRLAALGVNFEPRTQENSSEG